MSTNTNTRNANNARITLASTNKRIDSLESKLDSILSALNTLNAPKGAQQPKAVKVAKSATKPVVAKATKKAALAKPTKGWEIVKYSDKSFLAYGEATRNHKQALKNLGGKFNTFTVGEEKVKGWIFSSKRVSADVVAKRLSTPTKSVK